MEELVYLPFKFSSMSALWLIPQYVLLGFMEGFGGGGLMAHIYDNVPDTMKSFTKPFCELVLCIGKFGSTLVMSYCNFWFDKNINTSHLDAYFLMLAILCTLVYVFYLGWWWNFNDLDINNSAHGDLETAQGGVENDPHVQGNSNDEPNEESNIENIGNIAKETIAEWESIQEDEDEEIKEEGEQT